MNKLKQHYNKLYKYYNKELLTCHKYNFKAADINLDYFSTYLRYLRDYYMLTNSINNDLTDDIIFASLCAAVNEYELYMTCIDHYYVANNKGVVEPIDKTLTKEQVLTAYQTEKQTHWNTFWDLVKQHMESWEGVNGSTI